MSEEFEVAKVRINEYPREPVVRLNEDGWIDVGTSRPGMGTFLPNMDRSEANALFDALGAFLGRTTAETVGREAIQRCFDSDIYIIIDANQVEVLNRWARETADRIFALQLPAPQPVSTGEDALSKLIEALGWHGGTIHDAISAVKALRRFHDDVGGYPGLTSRPPVPYVVGVPGRLDVMRAIDAGRPLLTDMTDSVMNILTPQPDIGAVVEALEKAVEEYERNGTVDITAGTIAMYARRALAALKAGGAK